MYSDPQTSTLRVVLVGDSSVGKTSLLNKLVAHKFNENEQSTVGANYHLYSYFVDGKNVEIQVWDTAGQEKYRSLGPIYFRHAAGAIVVFDLTVKETFDHLGEWINSFTDVAGSETIICIAANKSDLNVACEVPIETAEKWAKANGYYFKPTSALTGEGVEELFQQMVTSLARSKWCKKQQPTYRELDDSEKVENNNGCGC